MAYFREGKTNLAVLGFLLGLGLWSAGAEGYFDDGRGLGHGIERYEVPRFDALEWMPTLPTEAGLVGGDAPEVFLAVASNYYAEGQEALPKYVRAMALVLAHQLNPESKVIRLANYQLRYRRQPQTVPGWEDREALAAKLWTLAWQAQKTEADRSSVGLLVLDLAAAFDPSNDHAMARYRAMSGGQMELRWAGAVRLPEGIDAPDYLEEEPEEIESEELAGAEPEPVPAPEFNFLLEQASVLVPAESGSGQAFVRLRARKIWVDPEAAAKRRKQAARNKEKPMDGYLPGAPLPVGFEVGQHNGTLAASVIEDLHRARAEFVRRRAGADIPEDLGVAFDIEDGHAPATGQLLSVAASVLLESMASGVILEPSSAAAGLLGFGSTLQPAPALGPALLRAAAEARAHSAGLPEIWPRLAVPVFSEDAFADLAALGEYQLLMDVQVIGCRKIDDAVGALAAEPDDPTARAIELFSDITRAARRTPPVQLLANAKVRARLAEVLSLCPEHLSAAQLLRAAGGSSATASLDGSVERLKLLDRQVRDWVQAHLGLAGATASGAGGDDACAEALATLRGLRPRLHPDARPYADGLTAVLEDLRVSLRSQPRSRSGVSGLAAQRAEALRAALAGLALEVASLGVEEP